MDEASPDGPEEYLGFCHRFRIPFDDDVMVVESSPYQPCIDCLKENTAHEHSASGRHRQPVLLNGWKWTR